MQEIETKGDHLEDLKGIAKAFTPEEWNTVINLIPSKRLGQELIKRATRGEEVLKKMAAIWEGES